MDEELIQIVSRLISETTINYVSEVALIRLLVEKGIFSKEEYDKKQDELLKQLRDKFADYLLSGKEFELDI